jgi:small subunit ribosomal protein S1
METKEPEQNSTENEGLDSEEEVEDFASLFEESQTGKDKRVSRDTKVEGTIVSIGQEWVFVDVGSKSEGVISKDELTDKEGHLGVDVGDRLTAYVVNIKGDEIQLSVKMTAAASEEAVEGAFRSGVPVEGLVTEERKGGYGVTVLGKQAFCPYSQMDLYSGGSPDDYVNQRFSFRIVEYSERGRNVVVSRRSLLEEKREEEKAQLKETLGIGDRVTGVVQNLTKFGAFVDIGGVQGLVPMSELAWHRVEKASDVLEQGQEVSVEVLALDWNRDRVTLSVKRTIEDPWTTISQRVSEETVISGTVTKLMDFGAFVELEPGIEGLIHISNLGAGRRINHPKEVVSEGDQVEVRVLSIDGGARRIGLELTFTGLGSDGEPVPELKVGDVVPGTVDSVKDYGVFVRLPGGKSGLLHVSQIESIGRGELRKKFLLDAEIQVEVLSIDPDSGKISLSMSSLDRKAEEARFKNFGSSDSSQSFGTLGDILKDKINK